MSKIHIITHARLNRATRKVAGELKRHRLWTNRLRNLPVVLVPVGFAHGWIWVGGTGEICIPRRQFAASGDSLMRYAEKLKAAGRAGKVARSFELNFHCFCVIIL